MTLLDRIVLSATEPRDLESVDVRRPVALVLASCGFLVAALTVSRVAVTLPTPAYRAASVWPFPGLYLVEIVALPFFVLIVVVAARPRGLPMAWAAIGALSTLALLGAMTIGPFVGAALVLLVPALLLGEGPSPYRTLVGAFAAGALFQAGAMFLAIQSMIR